MSFHEIVGLFPVPVYIAKGDSDLISREKKEIEKIIQEGMNKNDGNTSSVNNYIFDKNFKKIKQFCEHHIKKYVEEIIDPKEKLDFYITQSWLNVTEPGGFHHKHFHQNSIISGVFYIATVEDDKITFDDPNHKIKELINFKTDNYNIWNSASWFLNISNNELMLFPSWLSHEVELNEKATTDRISISFNIFIKGTLGDQKQLNELILK